MNKQYELMACPFCGNEAEMLYYDTDGYLPMCPKCEGMIEKWFDTPEKAAKAWNMRTEGNTHGG